MKTNKIVSWCFGFVFFTLAVFAGAICAKAETTWSGDVVIPDGGYAEIGDGDVAYVAGNVTSITIGEGARVVYKAATPLTLTAPVSGTGEFVGKGTGRLTLAGNNAGLVSPGHFSFTNTPVTVAHEYGLGGKSTAAAFVHIDNASGSTAAAIANRKNFSLVFQTVNNVFTNHCDIAFDTLMAFGSETDAETLVMDASLLWRRDEALNSLYCKGHVEFISGKWSSNWKAWKHGYTTKADGYVGRPTVKFSGDSYLETFYFFGGSVTWYFNSTSTKFRISNYTSTGVYVGCFTNALPKTDAYPYADQVIDLGGYDQELTGLNYAQYGTACTTAGTSCSYVRSETPARLVLKTSHTAANYASYTNWGVKVTGQAGILKDTTDPIVMLHTVSDTKGTLENAKGSLTLAKNAGWSDGTVKVSGGTLVCASVRSMASGRTKLEVADAGTLVVRDGVTLYVASAKLGSDAEPLARGTYSVASLTNDYPCVTVADGEAGTGVIRVCGEWKGIEAVDDLVVPVGTDLVVTDDDVAKLAAVKRLTLMDNVKVTLSNETERLDLAADVTAFDTVTWKSLTNSYAVLTGDNRNFLGQMTLANGATLIVSNRYGLGVSATKAVLVSKLGILQFGGNGLTNDVPITLYDGGTRQLQVNLNDGPLVLNGKLMVYSGPVLKFGDVIFNGTFQNSGASPELKTDSSSRSIIFNSKCDAGAWFLIGDAQGTLRFNKAGNYWSPLYCHGGKPKIVCGVENALTISTTSDTGYFYVEFRNPQEGYLDLNGFNQSIPYVYPNSTVKAGATGYYDVTSAEPATLTFTQVATTSYDSALRFTGQAGFTYAGAGTYRFHNQLSTSTGPLTVSSGTVAFLDDAGWSGDEINVTGGRLIIDSKGGIVNEDAVVTVSGDGVLEIGTGKILLVKKLVCRGTEVTASGRYTAAQLRQQGVQGLEGDGSLYINVDRNLYVDAVNGNDANDGLSASKPCKTLAGIMARVELPGSVVHAAPGVYASGEMTSVGTYTKDKVAYDERNRVILPVDVTLVGDQGAGVTFIDGADATEQLCGRCGTDAMRCVYMNKRAVLRGVTLRNGCTMAVAADTSSVGGGVYAADNSCQIIDCVITNCYSHHASAAYRGKYLRCFLTRNRCKSYSGGIDSAALVANCVFDNNGTYQVHSSTRIVNCTFLPGSQNTSIRSGGAGTYEAYNCIVGNYSGSHYAYRNCIFTEQAEKDLEKTGTTYTNCRCIKGQTDRLDAAYRPILGESIAPDWPEARQYYEQYVVAAFGEEAAYDYARGQRLYGASLDIGAGEYDYRADFARALDPAGYVTVTAADGDAALADECGVDLPADAALAASWTSASGLASTRYTFGATLEAGASLAVFVGDEQVATVTASGIQSFVAGPQIAVRLVAADGAVRVANLLSAAVAVITASDGGLAVAGGSIGANVAPAGGTRTLTFTRVFDSTNLATGLDVNGTFVDFDDYPNGYQLVLDDNNRSSYAVSVVYGDGKDWYVDPLKGNDDAKGYHRTCPKKTVQTVIDTLCAKGSTVHLLPGVYETGAKRALAAHKTLNRIYLPEGVNLVGEGKASEVIIRGEDSPEPNPEARCAACGADCVRCLYAVKGNTIRNVTLTGGRAYTDGYQNAAKADESSGGVRVVNDGVTLLDCVLSDNIANWGAAVNSATLIRCRVTRNSAYWAASGAEYCSLYNCIVDHNSGSYPVHYASKVVNCTLGPGNSMDDLRANQVAVKAYNTLIMKYVTSVASSAFYRTYFAGDKISNDGTATALNDFCVGPKADVTIDDDFVPAKGCAAIDAGNADYGRSLYPAAFQDEADYDFYGNPRQSGRSVDIGAVEFDWRRVFAADLGQRVTVTSASTNVTETAAGTVRLTDGARMELTWGFRPEKQAAYRLIPVCVTGAGVLRIWLGDTVLAEVTEGATVVRYQRSATLDELTFVFEGEGSAEISRMRLETGLVVTIR